MSTDNMFDILMEIRKVDKQISESKLELQKSQQDYINLEKKLNHTKELQSKASKVYYRTQKKAEINELELKGIHENYNCVLQLLKEDASEDAKIDDDDEKSEMVLKVEELKKHRDLLKQKLVTANSEEYKLLSKTNDVEVQINIQKKKNAAMQIRLQKCLQELMQDERKLEDELKSLTNN